MQIGWAPGAPNITLFWTAGHSEPWRPILEDIQAEDWELFPYSQVEERQLLHVAVNEMCKKLGM